MRTFLNLRGCCTMLHCPFVFVGFLEVYMSLFFPQLDVDAYFVFGSGISFFFEQQINFLFDHLVLALDYGPSSAVVPSWFSLPRSKSFGSRVRPGIVSRLCFSTCNNAHRLAFVVESKLVTSQSTTRLFGNSFPNLQPITYFMKLVSWVLWDQFLINGWFS